LALALDAAHLAAQEARRDRASELLASVETHLSKYHDDIDLLTMAFAALIERIGRTLHGSTALFLVGHNAPILTLAAFYYPDIAERENRRARIMDNLPRIGVGIIGTVALDGTPRLFPDLRDERPGIIAADATFEATSWLCVPLREGSRTLGVLTLGRATAEHLDDGDLNLLNMIAGRCTATLAQASWAQLASTCRALLAETSEPAFILNSGGNIVAANAAMGTLLGYTTAQLRERHIGDLLAPEQRNDIMEHLAKQILSHHAGDKSEWTLLHATGGRSIFEIRTQPFRQFGQPVEIYCLGHDLTAQQQEQRALERQGMDLATLHLAGLVLTDALEPTEIGHAFLGALRTAIPCDEVTLYISQSGTMTPELTLQQSQAGLFPAPRFPHGHQLIEWSITHAQSVLLNDATQDPAFAALAIEQVRHLLIVPLLAGGQVRGSVILRRKLGESFTLDDLRLVEALAAQVALTLHNARLNAESSGATTDLRTVLESIQQGVIMTDPAGRIRFANQRVGAMIGTDIQANLGAHLLDLDERTLIPQVRNPKGLLAQLTWLHEHPEEASTEEITLVRTSGRIFERYTGPMRHPDSGTMVGRLIVYTDVTEGRQLEHAKDEFLATASHELKTPLTTLGGYLEMLERQVTRPGGPDPTRLLRYVSSARSELGRLRRLSDDLLEVTRIEAGRLTMQFQWADLAATITETVERFVRRPGLEARGHRLICQIDTALPTLHDPLRIGQIITNLLENALKYSPEGGEVRICAACHDEEVIFSVRDSGIGIPTDERERLFLPFYRTTNASAGSPEGLGLGLYISRGIVEGHGGRIWPEQATPRGSIFNVALPINGPAHVHNRNA
jgi:PAS domain S-box-containing protein